MNPKPFFLTVCFTLSLLTAAAWAGDEPYCIENSRSPDGKIELWIKPFENAVVS